MTWLRVLLGLVLVIELEGGYGPRARVSDG